mgnify:CR=1 FL=1
MEGKAVKWDHIKDFHEQDANLPIRLARKLKKKHIELPGFKNMSVRLAAQTLSRSVAKGIYRYLYSLMLSVKKLL